MTTQCATETKPCCTCGGAGMQGHPEARYDEADAYDVCYHCGGTGNVDRQCCEPLAYDIVRAKAIAGEKFTDDDVTRELADGAKEYLRSYAGAFDFVLSMKASLEQYGGLRTAQVRGVLNCWAAEIKRALPAPAAAGEAVTVRNGYYTVVLEDGSHRTLRIGQAQLGANKENRQFIAFLRGSDNTGDYQRCAKVENGRFSWLHGYLVDSALRRAVDFVLNMNEAQEREAGKLYAMESGNCFNCGRLLTEPESIEAGLGPVCRVRMGL